MILYENSDFFGADQMMLSQESYKAVMAKVYREKTSEEKSAELMKNAILFSNGLSQPVTKEDSFDDLVKHITKPFHASFVRVLQYIK